MRDARRFFDFSMLFIFTRSVHVASNVRPGRGGLDEDDSDPLSRCPI